MELIATPWQALTTLLVFLVGIVVVEWTGKRFQTRRNRTLLLYCWHTLFCVLYAKYVIEYGGDALDYYEFSLRGDVTFSLGTDSVNFLTAIFAYFLGLSFLGTFFIYNILGTIGLQAFDASLRVATVDKSKNIQRLATIIVLLPSVSFWSASIGKDAIAFTATGLALWAALNLKHRTGLMVTAVILMLFVRPHIAGLMVIALAGSLIIQQKTSLSRRLLMGGAALAACAVMIPLALNYAGLDSGATSSDLNSYIEQRQQYNQEGGSGIDISSMSFPMQLFTFLFRPLPFEANSMFALAASVDNVILLLLFIAGGVQIIKRRKQALTDNRTFLWLYCLLSWSILAVNTANLGISMRQKWMFAPMLIFLLISVMGKRRKKSPRQRRTYAQTTALPVLRGRTSPLKRL